jgi:hypothetical protein
MKNIHVLLTYKPTGIFKSNSGLQFSIRDKVRVEPLEGFHIYITSDEEIKEGEYGLSRLGEIVKFHSGYDYRYYAKIILTTDQDLIKDGVQAITDEFLEWFVKNPSCESVETYSLGIENSDTGESGHYKYEIIIPQEEPKFGDSIEKSINIMSIANDMVGKKEEPKTNSCCSRCNGVDDICIFDREEPKQDTVGKEFYESADKVIVIHRPKQENRKVCKCKRAYENPLSEICSLCWNELYPNEKDEVKEEDLLEPNQETFIKSDNIEGQWLSPVPTERAWQEEKLVEIFGHYPTASPRWQYMNGLIQNSLDAKQMYSEEELRNAMNWMMIQYFEFYECPSTGRVNHYIQTIKQQEQ